MAIPAVAALVAKAAGPAIAKGVGTAGVSQASKKGPHYAAALSPYGRAQRKELKKDIEKLRTGQGFGPNEAEKRLMLNEASRSIREGTADLSSDLKRSAAAMGGYGRSGLQLAAAGRLAQARADAMAAARSQVDIEGRRMATEERDAAINRVAAARNRVFAERQGQASDGGLAAGIMAGTAKYRELNPASTPLGGARRVNKEAEDGQSKASIETSGAAVGGSA